MINYITKFKYSTSVVIPVILIFIMIYTRHHISYLAFHSFAEYFSVFVAFSISFTTYYTYNLTKNRYLLFLGLGFFWVGVLDILHTQTYPGMNLYDILDTNTTLTFWIFTRFLEAMILLFALLLRNKDFSILKITIMFALYSIFTLILAMYFPLELFTKESGLSDLKVFWEYMIILILLITLKLNSIYKDKFDINIYEAIQMAIIFTIIAEIFFTLYTDSYGLTNLFGHIFKFLSFWVLLVKLIKISLVEPQKRLNEQNTILNSVLNSTKDLIFYKDYITNGGRYVGCNEAFEKFVGKNNKDIVGKTDIELFGEEIGSFFYTKDKEMLDRDEPVVNKEWVEYPNGDKVLLDTSKTPFKDKNGTIIGVLGISRDITKEHRKSEEMDNLKSRMELAFLGNNAGVYEWYMLDNRAFYSSQWMNMLGYAENELEPHLSTWQSRVHPDDIDEIMISVQKAIEAKEKNIETIHRLKHKNGKWIWILGRGLIRYNEENIAYSMIGVHTDISEQKAIELKYTQQAQMIEQIHDSVISTDMEGIITNFNNGSEILLGYMADEIIGKHISKLYIEKDYKSLGKSIEVLIKDGEFHTEVHLIKKSGKIIDADLSLSLLKDDKGNAVGMIGYSQDITIRKKAENKLKEQHIYLQSIIDGIDDPIMVIKEDYTIEIMNSTLIASLEDISVADKLNPKCYEISHHRSTPCDGFNHPCPLREVLDTQKHTRVVHNHNTKDGDNRYIELSASPLFDKDNNCIGIIESARDITEHLVIQDELREQKSILNHQAHHDALTGLPNRVLFIDRLEQAIEKGKRSYSKFALLFIDLDHFKEINDSLGHAVGDEILKIVTSRLEETIRSEDTVARLGGDEFTVILEELNQAQDASFIANKILKTLSNSMEVGEHTLYVSSSIGISIYPDDGNSAQNLLKFADSAMYKAKDEGRNNFQYYNSSLTELAFERVVMETSLRNALKNQEFIVYYQPQVNGVTNKMIGMEALVRWQHPTMGLVSPSQFIALAERTGLIVELDRVIMEIAMTQIGKWYKDGLNPGVLAMNLSVKQIQQKDFIEVFEALIQKTGCKPEWLELEVTESQIMINPEEAIKTLMKLSDMGIELAIDDFGTGYSSLTYLKKLPIDKLKIDQAFIRDLPDDEEDAGITKAVIALAKSLNLRIIAEGVETKAQKDFIIEHGCINIQGYYYSKPIPTSDVTELLIDGGDFSKNML